MKETYNEDLFEVPTLEFEDKYLQKVYEMLDTIKPNRWYPIKSKEQEEAIKTLFDCKLARDFTFSEDFKFVKKCVF
jgi:hypothetical protein